MKVPSPFTSLVPVFLALSCLAGSLGSTDPSWPNYHGPRRDNLSTETGLLKTWPKDGPRLLWAAEGIGHGYSSVSVAEGRIFTAGTTDKQTYVTALELTGKPLWQRLNGESWEATGQQPWAVPYSGARGTPTIDGSFVYHLSELGRLAAFDCETGAEHWSVDVIKTFKAPRPKYGLSESILIQGDRLFCCPGGEEGYVVALDKATGRTLWAKRDIQDPIGYSSPVPAAIDGVEQWVNLSAQRIFAIAPSDGRLLWDYPFANSRGNSATDVVVEDGLVFASTGYGGGSLLLQPRKQPDGLFDVQPVWKTDWMDNHHGGVILYQGHLYGSGQESSGWQCLDFKTGQLHWRTRGKGSLTLAEGHLYCLDERGILSLVPATPEGWNEVSSFRLPSGGRGQYWAHPVICGGRLYVRHGGQLFAYDIRDPEP